MIGQQHQPQGAEGCCDITQRGKAKKPLDRGASSKSCMSAWDGEKANVRLFKAEGAMPWWSDGPRVALHVTVASLMGSPQYDIVCKRRRASGLLEGLVAVVGNY